MLRPWLTLYYGFCLFQLGFPSFARFGYQVAAQVQIAPPTWYFGSSVRFQRYADPLCTELPSSTNSTNIGWFGGEYSFTVPLTQPNCIKLPSPIIGQPANTYIHFRWPIFPANTVTCTPGGSPNFPNIDLVFHDSANCQHSPMSERQLGIYPNPEFPFLRDMNYCFRDQGSTTAHYYRIFCVVPEPTSTVTHNITTYVPSTHYVTNNITTYVPSTHYVTNNITTYVPTVVKPEDVMAMLMLLMVRNASFFKTNTVPAPAPPQAPSPISTTPNLPPKQASSASDTEMLCTYAVLWGLLFLAASFC